MPNYAVQAIFYASEQVVLLEAVNEFIEVDLSLREVVNQSANVLNPKAYRTQMNQYVLSFAMVADDAPDVALIANNAELVYIGVEEAADSMPTSPIVTSDYTPQTRQSGQSTVVIEDLININAFMLQLDVYAYRGGIIKIQDGAANDILKITSDDFDTEIKVELFSSNDSVDSTISLTKTLERFVQIKLKVEDNSLVFIVDKQVILDETFTGTLANPKFLQINQPDNGNQNNFVVNNLSFYSLRKTRERIFSIERPQILTIEPRRSKVTVTYTPIDDNFRGLPVNGNFETGWGANNNSIEAISLENDALIGRRDVGFVEPPPPPPQNLGRRETANVQRQIYRANVHNERYSRLQGEGSAFALSLRGTNDNSHIKFNTINVSQASFNLSFSYFVDFSGISNSIVDVYKAADIRVVLKLTDGADTYFYNQDDEIFEQTAAVLFYRIETPDADNTKISNASIDFDVPFAAELEIRIYAGENTIVHVDDLLNTSVTSNVKRLQANGFNFTKKHISSTVQNATSFEGRLPIILDLVKLELVSQPIESYKKVTKIANQYANTTDELNLSLTHSDGNAIQSTGTIYDLNNDFIGGWGADEIPIAELIADVLLAQFSKNRKRIAGNYYDNGNIQPYNLFQLIEGNTILLTEIESISYSLKKSFVNISHIEKLDAVKIPTSTTDRRENYRRRSPNAGRSGRYVPPSRTRRDDGVMDERVFQSVEVVETAQFREGIAMNDWNIVEDDNGDLNILKPNSSTNDITVLQISEANNMIKFNGDLQLAGSLIDQMREFVNGDEMEVYDNTALVDSQTADADIFLPANPKESQPVVIIKKNDANDVNIKVAASSGHVISGLFGTTEVDALSELTLEDKYITVGLRFFNNVWYIIYNNAQGGGTV